MTSEPRRRMLGLVTVGQSPRKDIMPQIAPFLPAQAAIRQIGALDSLSPDQIAALAPAVGDYVLHTRLRDGSAVTVGRSGLVSLMQDCLEQLQAEGANPIVLLCTGEFPELHSDVLLIEPDRLLVNTITGLGPRQMGVLVPLTAQVEAAVAKWQAVGSQIVFLAASPYGDKAELVRAAATLQEHSLEVVVMDCMGYTRAHKQIVAQATGCPVILASSAVARLVGELLE